MASPESALIAALKADGGVSALAGSRVFIHGAQQGATYPYITVQRIATTGAAYLDGPTNLEWPMIQVDCWSPAGLVALNTAEAIRNAIDGLQLTFGGLTISPVFKDQRGPAPDPETHNFRVSQDYHLFHERA